MNENLKPVEKLTPFTKMIMTIGTLPSSFYASMSYYESMVWLYEYLKNQVIPAVNNNAEAVEELQTAFITLKNWIENYFENLDVQEEINKKLDKMAEDGTLTNLIKNYVDPIFQEYQESIDQQVGTFTNLFNSEINTLTERVDAYSTNPIPVSSTSDMTDTTRIYVNTTNGYWYYYNGSAWTQGGLYQSAEIITDKTLTEDGVPADAKIVGDYVLNNFTNYVSRNLLPENNIKSGFISAAGVYAESTTYYCLINPIDVSSYHGKTLYFSNGREQKYMRFLCAYNSSMEPVENEGISANTYTYTVPDDIDYINPSFTAPYNLLQLEIDRITTTSTYFNKLEVDTNDKVKTSIYQAYNKSLDIATLDEEKTFNAIQCKKNFDINFYGKLSSTFSGVRIGQGKNQSNGYNIHITPTQMSYQNGTTDAGGVNHGLTIKDYISVNISIQQDGKSHITISTNGGKYTRNVIDWLGSNKNIFVIPDDITEITDAKLSYVAKDSKKPIWYFGDSYISIGETRFPYYLNELGYLQNMLLDGFAGANSAEVYPDVTELINNGYKPKYLIWALGMNNPDSGSINASWIGYLTYLWDLCNQNNIELILCTIPNTPFIDNTYKNAYIRNSGLKYIDYSKAVNTSIESNTWLTGMLSNDNVHPTAEGARCLAQTFLNDFPIIEY